VKERLAHNVRQTGRAYGRALTLSHADHGESFGHSPFLRILWERDGLTQRELSELAGVMEPTTFAALKTMEQLGYVERRQAPGNRKNVYVHLTQRGRALKKKLVPLARDVNKVATRGLEADALATTRRVLLAMLDNLGRSGK
jgi:DNA-binding MarR family transcriptional regulator